MCVVNAVTKMKYVSKATTACKTTRKTVLLKTHNFLISINVTYNIQLLQLSK